MIEQLKQLPKTNQELTRKTVEKIQDAYHHMLEFFKSIGGAPDRTVVYAVVNEIFSRYQLPQEQKPRLYEVVIHAVFGGGDE